MPRPAPTYIPAHLRLRRRARLASLGFALVAAYLVIVMVRTAGGALSPLAMVPYLLLCALGATAFRVLRRLWRRALAARPVVVPDGAGPGAVAGVPELDAEPRPHLGLSGELDPPRRW